MFGKDGVPLVVRQRAPAWRTALLVAAALVGLFGLYVMYELGRYNAGYDRLAVAQQRTALEVRIEHLEKDNRELRTRLAETDTIRAGRAREQAEVARARPARMVSVSARRVRSSRLSFSRCSMRTSRAVRCCATARRS